MYRLKNITVKYGILLEYFMRKDTQNRGSKESIVLKQIPVNLRMNKYIY